MNERPERLSDEQVAAYAALLDDPIGFSHGRALAREVQATRLLLNGGRCPTCKGKGYRRKLHGNLQCDCVNGRVPGLAERLEAAMATTGTGTLHYKMVATIISDIRHLAGES